MLPNFGNLAVEETLIRSWHLPTCLNIITEPFFSSQDPETIRTLGLPREALLTKSFTAIFVPVSIAEEDVQTPTTRIVEDENRICGVPPSVTKSPRRKNEPRSFSVGVYLSSCD